MTKKPTMEIVTLLAISMFASSGCSRDQVESPAFLSSGSLGALSRPQHVVDLAGAHVDPLDDTAELLVLIFIATECPIANRCAPEVIALSQEFAGSEVRFRPVYPDPNASPATLRQHAEEFGYGISPLWDSQQELVRMTGAAVTPEAAVIRLHPQPHLVYRGRINDRFVEFGKTRAKSTKHDLRDALTAALDQRNVEPRFTEAVGCPITELP